MHNSTSGKNTDKSKDENTAKKPQVKTNIRAGSDLLDVLQSNCNGGGHGRPTTLPDSSPQTIFQTIS